MKEPFIESTRHGYYRIATGGLTYLKGIWLQFSRGMLFILWFLLPVLLSAPFGLINETLQAIAGFVFFLLFPVFWGYIDLYHIHAEDN